MAKSHFTLLVVLLLGFLACAYAALDGEVYDATDSVGENQLGLDVKEDAIVYDIIGSPMISDGSPAGDMEAPTMEMESLENFNIECRPDSEVLRFSVNYLAGGVIGYYVVEGCEGVSPTLILKKGTEYVFEQMWNVTNWYHPLGFAYYPDGAHGWLDLAELPELEIPTPDLCDLPQFQCNPGADVEQAPLYDVNGVVDTYENWNGGGFDVGDDGYGAGLDVYEPMFQIPLEQWVNNEASIRLMIPPESKTQFVYYFCHVHYGMSGIMKFEEPTAEDEKAIEEVGLNELQIPFTPATYYITQSEFDSVCGTAGINEFAQTDEFCPEQIFLCNATSTTFSDCITAIDCQMRYEMTTAEFDNNPLVTFMHQMIPHHQNAVNMAKILLNEIEGTRDLYPGDDEEVSFLLYEIINQQSMQIQFMNSWLINFGTQPESCADPPNALDIFGVGSATS